ncbi:lambda exonuclease family protein [Candidatus Williamhamiltonella defendens]|uniref:lambda exonuclease family protein n=1 Tax=Candidatus Williamhamiltonella defendens TaxID=138072 RepID=UPI0002DD0096|nr:lambda exonuclease family protein [Candidatus Hamiltonella defensa]
MQQRTPDWFEARCGKVTASRLGDLMAKTRVGHAASRARYQAELICERLTGQREEGFVTAAMRRGMELEPEALDLYRLYSGNEVKEVGLIAHPALPDFAASPDGLVHQEGLLEIKCPNAWTHLELIKTGQMKTPWRLQMQAQMMCTGRAWCDFVSYDNRFPPELAYFQTRVSFDPLLNEDIEQAVRTFLNEIEEEIECIKRKAAKMPYQVRPANSLPM